MTQEGPDGRYALGKICGRDTSAPLEGAGPRGGTLLTMPRVHPAGSSLNPVLWLFVETSLFRHKWLNHWPLEISSTSVPFPLLGGGRGRGAWEFQPPNHRVGSPDNRSPFLGASQKLPHQHKLWRWKRLVINNKRHPFHFYASLRTEEIPRVLRALYKEQGGGQPRICYRSQYHKKKRKKSILKGSKGHEQ